MTTTIYYKVTTSSADHVVEEEMAYISALYGARGMDWKKGRQLFFEKTDPGSTHSIPMDLITIELADGSRLKFEFDLTSVYGSA